MIRQFSSALVILIALARLPAQAQFESRSSFDLNPLEPDSVIVGDFNGDGILDLAVVSNLSFGGGLVEIRLGNGDGTFRSGESYSVDVLRYGATASLRSSGVLDLVLGGGDEYIYVMLGNGDGTFQSPVGYPTSANSLMIVLGDFLGTGNVDVADLEWANAHGVVCNCVEVLPGNGNGTFGAPITTPVPYDIDGFALAAGDFNNDGKLDVAVGGQFFSTSKVDILLGNGDGTFTDDGYYVVGAAPDNVVSAHFTRDKTRTDLAVADGGAISVLLGNGDGTFQQPVIYGTGVSWVIAQDFNGDGKVDLAAAGDTGGNPPYTPGIHVLNGNGNGTFPPGIFYPTVGKTDDYYVAVGDFNNDGKPDLVAVNTFSWDVITLLNTGVVNLSPTTPLNFADQSVGTTSKAQSVTVRNTGTSVLKIKSIKASAEFAVTSTCGSSVAAGGQCDIGATFSPTKKGAVQGTISIIDSASSKPQAIELRGTGT